MVHTVREPGRLGRAVISLVASVVLLGSCAVPALADAIQFLGSDPAPGGTAYTLAGRYLLNVTLSVEADTSGTYGVFVGTRLPPYPDYCSTLSGPNPVGLVAGQPKTITVSFFTVGTNCPMPHTNATLQYCLHPPGGPGPPSVCNESAIPFTFVDASPPGGEADPYFPIGTTSNDGGKAVAFDGTNFLVTWVEQGVPRAARVTVDGAVVDPGGFAVGSAGSESWTNVPAVGFDGANFLTAWASGSAIHGARVTPGGVVLDSPELAILEDADVGQFLRPWIAFDGTNYLIAWGTPSGAIRVARVSPAGVSLDGTAGFPMPSQLAFFGVGGVAYGGGQYLVVGGRDAGVSAARLTPDGQVLDPAGIMIASGANLLAGFVASDGDGFLVTWSDYMEGSAWAVRVSADGAVLDDPPLELTDDHRVEEQGTAVTFDGTNYLAVWQVNRRGPRSYLNNYADAFGRRISRSGVVEGEPIPLATATANQTKPTVAFGAGRHLVAWTETGFSPRCPGACTYARIVPKDGTPVTPAPPASPPVLASWMPAATPTSDDLFRLWAADPANVYAVGDSGTAMGELFSFDGSSWRITAGGLSGRGQTAIWGTSPLDVWIVGGGFAIHHYDGDVSHSSAPLEAHGMGILGDANAGLLTIGTRGIWVRTIGLDLDRLTFGTTGIPTDLSDIWGTGPQSAYAVGELGTVLYWNGTSWTRIVVPTIQGLNGIWGSGPSDVFVVGDAGTILHYDGGTWSRQTSGVTEDLLAVDGAHGEEVYAVGAKGVILHYDGTSWTREESGTTFNLYDVAVSGNAVWAVGDAGTILTQPAPTIAIDDVSGSEGDAGMSDAVFTVSLSAPGAVTVTVAYATADGTATASSDYAPTSGTLTFMPGETSQRVTVSVLGDVVGELDETFVVTLSSPTAATIGDPQGVGTILNDDPPTVSISDASVVEGTTAARDIVFTVSLSIPAPGAVSVAYQTADGTATAGEDYVPASGTVDFAMGETTQQIAVSVIGDLEPEPNETFFVRLSDPAGAVLGDAEGVGTIVNDEGGRDFDGDGHADILWHNQVTGGLYVWFLGGTNGIVTVNGSYLTPASFADTRWQIRGIADFDGDGNSDVLWHHQGNGSLYVWFLGGTNGIVTQHGSYLTPSSFSNTQWQIRGVADFDGDGNADVLWHNQVTGDLYVWFLGGTDGVVTQHGSYLTPSRFADTSWQIRGIADFDADGDNDILWHHQGTGSLYVWFLGGTGGVVTQNGSYLTPSRFSDTSWKIVEVADFDGDGNSDLLWHHQGTGDLYVWFLGGTGGVVTQHGSYLTPSRFADTNWKVVPR